MIFQGDVSKYHPADALMFLSQLSLNGVLTIACEQQIVILTFKAGHIADAHSRAGDEKLLQVLRFNKVLTAAQESQVRKVRSEAGMPVRQVLAELRMFALEDIKKWIEVSINEVLLELFLMERGEFHFTDTMVESDDAGIEQDTVASAIRILSHAEELRDFEKSIVTLDRGLVLKASNDQLAELPQGERAIAYFATRISSIRQLLALAPYYSHEIMRTIEKFINAKLFDLTPVSVNLGGDASGFIPPADSFFDMYRQTFKVLVHTDEVLKKVEAVIGFCKKFYDGILILTARERQIVHCKAFTIKKGHNVHQRTLKGGLGSIDQDPVFQAVNKTGLGFFGKVFPSYIISRAVRLPDDGECALFPIVIQPQLSMFFYAFCNTSYEGLSPHHYLELLSWMIMPKVKADPIETPATGAEDSLPAGAGQAPADQEDLTHLVARIDELPPLPAIATRALQLLSDPEASTESVEKAIAHDQALVAKLIRVSNSALYGGFQKVESLRQALTRLGAKTTKGLILAASTRSYFFKERKGMKVWGPILWQHSVECGLAARRIADACGHPDPEQAFIGGIMHDIGKLVILMIDEKKYQEINRIKVAEQQSALAAEVQVVGTSHSEIGQVLMEKWSMPEAVRACAAFHHNPEPPGEHTQLVAIVTYANHISHVWGRHPQTGLAPDDALLNGLLQTIGISPDQNDALIAQIQTDFQNADMLD